MNKLLESSWYGYTIKEHIVGWSQLIGVFAFIGWTIYAMIITAPFGLLVMGGLLWWGFFAFETAMNSGKTDIESLFGWAGNDFKNNFGSNTWEHRLSLTRNNDEEWAEMFPGKVHCIFTHVLLPLIPLLIWIIV